jgi:hypothetical protein
VLREALDHPHEARDLLVQVNELAVLIAVERLLLRQELEQRGGGVVGGWRSGGGHGGTRSRAHG